MKVINSTLLTFLCASAFLISCSQSDFSGGAGNAKKGNKNRTGDERPESIDNSSNGTSNGNNTGNGDLSTLESGSGGVEGCALGSMIEDPNVVETFNSSSAVATVNSLPDGLTEIPSANSYAGAFHYDKPTADAVCKLQAFVESTSFTHGKYESCPDNAIATWNEGRKDFDVINACKDNNKIKSVTCKGKLKDPCKDNKSWIFKK
jgi:hypothetical protein